MKPKIDMTTNLKTSLPRNIVLRNYIIYSGLLISLVSLLFSENRILISSDPAFYFAIFALFTVTLLEYFVHKRHSIKFDDRTIFWTRAGLPHPWAKQISINFADIGAVTSIDDRAKPSAIAGVLINSSRAGAEDVILARGYLGDEGIRAVLRAIEQHGFRNFQDEVRETFLT